MEKVSGKLIVCVLIGLLTAMASSADVSTDLVGYWPLDGDATDHSGFGNDGVVMGGAEWVAGYRGQGIHLAGDTGDGVQHVYIPDFALTSNTITWVAWINGWKNDTWTGLMVSRGTMHGGAFDNGVGFGDGDALHYTWTGNTTWNWHGGPVIPQDTWAMIAVSLAPNITNAYVYTDAGGLQAASNEADNPEETIEHMRLGWDECCGGSRWFVGIMDEVLMYDRALSEDDIMELAVGGPTAVEPATKLTTTWGSLK